MAEGVKEAHVVTEFLSNNNYNQWQLSTQWLSAEYRYQESALNAELDNRIIW